MREREREGGGRLLLSEICSTSCSNIGADEMLYSEKDLEKSMDKIETINFHQVSTSQFFH